MGLNGTLWHMGKAPRKNSQFVSLSYTHTPTPTHKHKKKKRKKKQIAYDIGTSQDTESLVRSAPASQVCDITVTQSFPSRKLCVTDLQTGFAHMR